MATKNKGKSRKAPSKQAKVPRDTRPRRRRHQATALPLRPRETHVHLHAAPRFPGVTLHIRDLTLRWDRSPTEESEDGGLHEEEEGETDDDADEHAGLRSAEEEFAAILQQIFAGGLNMGRKVRAMRGTPVILPDDARSPGTLAFDPEKEAFSVDGEPLVEGSRVLLRLDGGRGWVPGHIHVRKGETLFCDNMALMFPISTDTVLTWAKPREADA